MRRGAARWHARHPGPVDRGHRGRQVLDAGVQRPEDARGQRHPDRGDRWPEGHARGAGRGVSRTRAADDGNRRMHIAAADGGRSQPQLPPGGPGCLVVNAIREVQEAADARLTDYNTYRPHDSLGNMSPVVFRPRVSNQEVSTSELPT